MKKFLLVLFLSVNMLTISSINIQAEENTEVYAENTFVDNTSNMTKEEKLADNIFVIDDANVLTDDQEIYIYELNKNVLETLKDKPQMAFVTIKDLPEGEDIDSYRYKKFQELGVGQKGIDNGLLFVLAVNDRQYGLEVGYGLEGIITDSSKSKLMNNPVIGKLKEGNYGDALVDVASNITSMLRHSELGDNSEAIEKQKLTEEMNAENERAFSLVGTLFKYISSIIVIIGLGLGIREYLTDRKKQKLEENKNNYYNNLISKASGLKFEQKEIIDSIFYETKDKVTLDYKDLGSIMSTKELENKYKTEFIKNLKDFLIVLNEYNLTEYFIDTKK